MRQRKCQIANRIFLVYKNRFFISLPQKIHQIKFYEMLFFYIYSIYSQILFSSIRGIKNITCTFLTEFILPLCIFVAKTFSRTFFFTLTFFFVKYDLMCCDKKLCPKKLTVE